MASSKLTYNKCVIFRYYEVLLGTFRYLDAMFNTFISPPLPLPSPPRPLALQISDILKWQIFKTVSLPSIDLCIRAGGVKPIFAMPGFRKRLTIDNYPQCFFLRT